MNYSSAQKNKDSIQHKSTWQNFTYDLGTILKSIGHSYVKPLDWKSKQWKTFGGVAAGTGFFYLFDEESSRFIRNQRSSIPEIIRDYGTNVGSPQYNYLLTGGVYLTGLFTKNEKLRRTGVLLVASASSAGLLQQVFKQLGLSLIHI